MFKRILGIRVKIIKKRVIGIDKKKPISVFFIVQFPECGIQKKVYTKKCAKMKDSLPRLFVLPKVIGAKNGVLRFDSKNSVYDFLNEKYDNLYKCFSKSEMV